MSYFIGVFLYLVPFITNGYGLNRTDFRIVGGGTIDITKVPYQVAVFNLAADMYCGGSILSNTVILTACHCFEKVTSTNQVFVKAGTNYRNNNNDPVYRLRTFIIHPNFNLQHLTYDVAIIHLYDQLVYSNIIKPIALPQDNEYIPEGTIGLASGWGYTSDPGPSPSDLLKAAYLSTMNQQTCEQIIERESSFRIYVRNTFFCLAGQNFQDSACHGDSGGPWVVNGVLQGATSWGFSCGRRNLPVIYSKISAFLPFIRYAANQ